MFLVLPSADGMKVHNNNTRFYLSFENVIVKCFNSFSEYIGHQMGFFAQLFISNIKVVLNYYWHNSNRFDMTLTLLA